MIALAVALICVRVVLAALGAAFGLVLAGMGLAIEVPMVGVRRVLWPVLVFVARGVRRLTAGRRIGSYTPSPQRAAGYAMGSPRALTRQAALLAGTRAARI